MPPLGPIRRPDLIRHLRQMGFDGPIAGRRHHYMIRNAVKVFIPNPHRGDIGVSLLGRILREAGIDRADWERL